MSEWKKGSDKVPEPIVEFANQLKLVQSLLEQSLAQLVDNKTKAELELQKIEAQKRNRRTKNGWVAKIRRGERLSTRFYS